MNTNRTFKVYIYKVLKTLHPSTGLNGGSLNVLESMLHVMGTKLAEQAIKLTSTSGASTVSSRDVQTAVRLLLPGKLCQHAVSNGTEAVAVYAKASGTHDHPQTREAQAGLQLSVSLVEKYLRGYGKSALKVGSTAPIYLAAVMEYLLKEVLEFAGNVAQDHKRARITSQIIYQTLMNDEELNLLFMLKWGLVIPRGGVLPCIHSPLLTNKSKNKSDDKKKSSRRNKRGTVALKMIRKLQQSTDMQFQHAPFERMVRKLAKTFNVKTRFSEDAVLLLQHFIESYLEGLMRQANLITLHADRETLMPKDLRLAMHIRGEDWSTTVDTPPTEDSVTNPGIRRLSYQAGVKSFSEQSFAEVKYIMKVVLSNVVHDVIRLMEHTRHQTVNVKMVKQAFQLHGVEMATMPHSHNKSKSKSKSKVKPKSESNVAEEVPQV